VKWFSKTFFLFLLCASAWAKSPYRYSFNPNNAEAVFAQLAGRPRLLEGQWLNIIGDLKNDTHTVTRGENLWRISRKLFRDPYLWRKLWAENPFLSNPHELSVGDKLIYFAPGINRGPASEADEEIPIVKLTPQGQGGYSLDNDSFANLDMKNRFVPPIMVLSPDEKVFGEISGSYVPGEGLTLNGQFYLDADEENSPVVGSQYAIVHHERVLHDKTQPGAPVIGELVTVVGMGEIIDEGERYFKGEIRSASGFIRRGDKLIELRKPVAWSIFVDPPNELQTRVVMGEEPDAKLFGQGQIVLLNKGTADGMKEGFVFRVWKDTDGHTEHTEGVEPESKGEIRVIQTGALSSIGYILRNDLPIEVGDTAVPRQVFVNPPPPPQKNYNQIEID
jgi:hypothetical protein